jgi:carbohydrate ABC transporter membrane protein 1, CUT1 family (TC 3.A.1.1.-)
VIAVVCWQYIPFYMVLFMAGLASFPAEISEAAKLDGASETTIFWKMKLPHLKGTSAPPWCSRSSARCATSTSST